MYLPLAAVTQKFLSDPTLAPKTKQSYECTLLPFVERLGSEQITQVPREKIQAYLDSLTNLSWRTHNRHQAIIHRLLNFAIEQGYITANPCSHIKRKKPDRKKGESKSDEKVRYLSEESLQLLFQVVRYNKRLQALVLLLYESGARISEVLTLKLESVDFSAKQFIVTGKGNKERLCFFDKKAYDALRFYIKREREHPGEALFTERGVFDRRVKPLSYQNARRDLLEAIDGIAQLGGLRFHDLRHTFATERAKIIPIEVLRALLGHESLQTTLIYQQITSRVAGNTAREAFRALYKPASNSIYQTPS